jgi:hypothetical protein
MASVAACRSERALANEPNTRSRSSSGNLSPIECDPLRVLGLSEPRIAPRFALTSVALTNMGTSARGRSAVHYVREDASAPRGLPARRRTVGLGATAQGPIRSQSARSTRANAQRGLGSRKQKGIAISGAMSPTTPPGGLPRNTRRSSKTRTTRATAPAIGAPPIPRGAIPAIHGLRLPTAAG